jgi:transcriptional regulator with XRE-family HTH domain
MPTRGPTLRRERRLADVSATAVAARMGVSRQTLWAIERAVEVTPERVAAYRAAVETLRDTKGEAA